MSDIGDLLGHIYISTPKKIACVENECKKIEGSYRKINSDLCFLLSAFLNTPQEKQWIRDTENLFSEFFSYFKESHLCTSNGSEWVLKKEDNETDYKFCRGEEAYTKFDLNKRPGDDLKVDYIGLLDSVIDYLNSWKAKQTETLKNANYYIYSKKDNILTEANNLKTQFYNKLNEALPKLNGCYKYKSGSPNINQEYPPEIRNMAEYYRGYLGKLSQREELIGKQAGRILTLREILQR